MNKALPALAAIALAGSLASCGFFRGTSRSNENTVDSTLALNPDTAALAPDTGRFVHFGTIGPTPDSTFADESAKPENASHVAQGNAMLLAALRPRWVADTSWSSFSGRAKLHFEGGGQSHDFAASIRMEQGKSIWISATALLNLEIARVLITPDSIWILNRLSREARVLAFSQINLLLPLPADFGSLQSLITGAPLQTGHQPMIALDTAGTFVLGYASPDFVQMLQFSKPDTSLDMQYIAARESTMQCEYKSQTMVSGRRFSSQRELSLSDRGASYRLSIEFSKAAFNEPVELPFSIPDSYQRK